MPIILKDIEWTQTENVVIVKVPLRGIHPSKVDIFHSQSYIKASFEHFFFEAFLSFPVKRKESRCILTPTHIIYELIKCQTHLWDKLELDLPKSEKQNLKNRFIEEEHKMVQQEKEQLTNQKSELKRLAVREQMALDAQQSQNIEHMKEEEKKNALEELNLIKNTETTKCERKLKLRRPAKGGFSTTKQESVLEVPPPRSSTVVKVSFTPRDFPTPCRESRLEEENEWLKKQTEARRSVGFISEDLRPEEHNPQFLKSKGDEFLRNGNYLGAISAYSFGIKLNDKFADLFVGRAESHLAVGNYNKSIQDCTKALELMKPEVPLNLRERANCIGWRGIALIYLGVIPQGIGELKASLCLLPNENFSFKLNEALEKLEELNHTS